MSIFLMSVLFASAHVPALERSGAAHGLELRRVYPVALSQIPQGEFVSHWDAEALSRVPAHKFQQLLQAYLSGEHQVGIQQGKSGLQSNDAEGALFQPPGLLLLRVGRMVGGNDLNRAVLDTLYESKPVLPAAHRRVHLEAAIFL